MQDPSHKAKAFVAHILLEDICEGMLADSELALIGLLLIKVCRNKAHTM